MTGPRCARHDLATGADGLCVVCRREREHAGEHARIRQADKVPRLIAKLVIGTMAGLATFFLLMALFDTNDSIDEAPPQWDAAAG